MEGVHHTFSGDQGQQERHEGQGDGNAPDNGTVNPDGDPLSQSGDGEHEGDNANDPEDVLLPFELAFGLENREVHTLLVSWASNIGKSPGDLWNIVTTFVPPASLDVPLLQGSRISAAGTLVKRMKMMAFENDTTYRLHRNRLMTTSIQQ